jgi:tetratricopeptide (TPR) repeat protein
MASGTATTRRRSRTRRPASASPALAGGLLGAAIAVVLLGNGGTLPWSRALGCVVVACALGVLSRASDERLGQAALVRPLAVAASIAALATAIGLLPLPRVALEWLAPGTAAARPDDAIWTVALRPEGVVDALAGTMLVAGAALAAAGAVAARHRAIDLARPDRIALAVWIAFGLLHVVTGATEILGIIPHQSAVEQFFAPMVNPNHWATVALILLPSATVSASTRGSDGQAALAIGLLGSAGVAMTGSVAATALLPAAWLAPGRSARGLLGLGILSAAVGAGAMGVASALHRDWVAASLTGRADHWLDATRLVADHPWFGTGAGSFGAAFFRVDSDGLHHALGHLHSDLAEWWIERGLVGLVASVGMAFLLVRAWPAGRDEALRTPAALGVALGAAHSFVDFPLHLAGPATLLAATAGVAWAAGERAPGDPAAVRRIMKGCCLLALCAALWEGRSALRQDLFAGPVPSTLGQRLFPGDGRTLLARADAALGAGRAAEAHALATEVAAAHPDDPVLLRRAAIRLAAAGDAEAADRALVRALSRAPFDASAWRVRGRLARAQGDPVAVDYYAAALRSAAPDPTLLDEALDTLPVTAAWVETLADAPAATLMLLARRARAERDPWSEADALWRAIQRNPAAYGRLADLGPALARAGRPREGEAWLRHLVAEDPRHYKAWMALGNLLADHGGPAEAVSCLLTAGTQIPVALARAVEVSWSFGGTQAGRALATRLSHEGRDNPWLHLVAARMDAEDGDGDACRQRIAREGLADGPPVAAEARRVLASCGP